MPVPATHETDLHLKEVFSSLQGEGVLIGRRQLFVRMAYCNLACAYCDTDFAAGPVWSAEVEPGSARVQGYPNPVSTEVLTELVRGWQELFPLHHSLALTGGEPLLQSEALADWLPAVSRILPVYLETNGTLPGPLAELLPYLTWISMDIKLAASTGVATPWDVHEAFLKSALPKICQVKLVVDEYATDSDLADVALFVQRHGPGLPLVLQPRTVAGRPAVGGGRLLAMQEVAGRRHPETLVIPQVHPFLSVR